LITWRQDLCLHDLNGKSPLIIAVEKGHLLIIQNLLKYGINEDSQNDRDSATKGLALLIAAKLGQADIVRLLLEHIAEDPQRMSYYSTALLEAAENGQEDVVRLLIEQGAKLDERRLAIVVLAGREECLRILLSKVAYIPNTNSPLNSALETAIWINHPEIVRLIQEHQITLHQINRENNSNHEDLTITDTTTILLEESVDASKSTRQLISENAIQIPDFSSSPKADYIFDNVFPSPHLVADSKAEMESPGKAVLNLIMPTPSQSRPSTPPSPPQWHPSSDDDDDIVFFAGGLANSK